MRLLSYHLRLAWLGLRRDPGLALVMLVALALSNAVWTMAVSQYVRFGAFEVQVAPTLHQVEILRPRGSTSVFSDGAALDPYLSPTSILERTQHTWAECKRLGESRVPARASDGVRADVLVRGPEGAPDVRVGRFTNAGFFDLFGRTFSSGGAWTPDDEAAGTPVVVLGLAAAQAMFPRGGAVGATVWVEGRAHRVVGVLARHQPLNAPWQLLLIGGHEDAIFLPLPELERLGAYPNQPINRAPFGPGHDAVLASEAVYAVSWVDLPTPAHVEAYRADLDRLVGPGRWALRSLGQWRREFTMQHSQIAFFSFLGLVVLLGGASNLSRWLYTKGIVRGEELGIYRALGATRASIFARAVLEGLLLVVPAALLGPIVAQPIFWLFNHYIDVVDMPLEPTGLTIFIGVAGPLLAGALGTLPPAFRLSRTRPTLRSGGTT
jgi:putative ABC transport system permease protein